ncbi:hypothetical protein [Pararhodobacter oceanensis]|uniref:hypothetical protein n=1 Tax=Pararhodobacter oceanensis TaxID=2172121 RepID=UPI003A8ECD1F
MRITASQSFERSRDEVLAALRDPAPLEAVMREMGAQVARIAEPPAPRWECQLIWRNLPHSLRVSLSEPRVGAVMAILVNADHATAILRMALADLPEGCCRIDAEVQLQAKTLFAKLALRSAGLMRGRAEARLIRLITALGQG